MTSLDLKYLKKFIKEKTYCNKCGRECIKKITRSHGSYDSETGKYHECGAASVRCPKAKTFGIFNFTLHTDYMEDGDMSFD